MHTVPLASTTVGFTGAPHAVYVLHGIFGRGRNWLPVARRLVETRPAWRARLVDLRHHGDSPRPAPPHTLDACAGDVVELLHEEVVPVVLVGHSFGGKVALLAAARAPELVSQVWLIDSTPAARAPFGEAWQMLDVVAGLPDRFASRRAAVDAMVERGMAPAVASWMSSNLAPTHDGFHWRIDLGAMRSLVADFFRTDLWDVVEGGRPAIDLHVVSATQSTIVDAAAVARLEVALRAGAPVHLHHVEAGHWINADNPDVLLDLFGAWMV